MGRHTFPQKRPDSGGLQMGYDGASPMPFTLQDLPAVYDELRRKAREMSRGAPATLVATAGLHEALARVLGSGRTEWNDRAHFVGHCLVALRRTWIDHWRGRRRHHAVDALRAVQALGVEARVEGPEEIFGALGLLEDLLADGTVKQREKIVEVVECRHLLGMTVAEAADVTGISVGSAKAYQAFFRAWALRRVAPERGRVEDAARRIGADPALRHGARVAEVARRVCLAQERPAQVAASTGRTTADVLEDLRFFHAWMERDTAHAGAAEGAR